MMVDLKAGAIVEKRKVSYDVPALASNLPRRIGRS